ncbi:cation diffusion facilitator family transporter [Olsenella massiliensis]|uniref:cation diffusion facilitator family transporter n=1 Tax=Olsenella massiliensis TaxID=1622075 RepID=UPI00071DAA14|nr:cation diffusion facilitator family transporter [Olsenella massiliensis]
MSRQPDLAQRVVARFVPDATNVLDRRTRNAYGLLSSLSCIVLNVLLCFVKGVAGVLAGSVSIVADALNNLSDASSNVVSLLGFKLASRPADEQHPYGHGRYEYLAGVVVAVLVVAVGLQLARQSVEKILAPSPTEFGWLSAAALLLSIAVKAWMARFNHRLGARIDSTVLEATSQDSRNDVITTSAVLLAALVSALTGVDLDGWAGLGVSAFIMVSGIGLLRDTIDPLMGNTPSEELVARVHAKIVGYPGVLGAHDLLIHDYGPGHRFASAHVEMAADTSVRASHHVLDRIEDDLLREEGLRTVLHCDPIDVHNGPNDLRNWVEGRLREIDGNLSVHDVTYVPQSREGGSQLVRLDCWRPDGLEVSDDELRRHIEDIVHERHPGATVQITIDTGFISPAE